MAPRTWGNIVTEDYVPDEISRRQFYQTLANGEEITKAEALAAITNGTLPAAFEAMVDAVADEDLQWQARMLLAGATSFRRSNWFVGYFGFIRGMSSADLDELWRDGAALD